LLTCRHKDAKKITIYRAKKSNKTKFKLRTNKYLYTLVLREKEKALRLRKSLPPQLDVEVIGADKKKEKKKEEKKN
jgi:large subunit ribosomal protein L38e